MSDAKPAYPFSEADIGMCVVVRLGKETHRGLVWIVNSDFIFVATLEEKLIAAPHGSVEPDPWIYGET